MMEIKTIHKEAYEEPEVGILSLHPCDVLASSDPKGGQFEDVDFEDWDL